MPHDRFDSNLDPTTDMCHPCGEAPPGRHGHRFREGSWVRLLSLTKLANADYLIEQVARGLDEYYFGAGEAPGVWHGRWADELGLEGVVDHDDLRALLDARHPDTGADLVAGQRERTVKAFDATFSAPKSASLLWTFGTAEVAATVAIAHVESVSAALDVLEAKAAVARQQHDGIRRRGHHISRWLRRSCNSRNVSAMAIRTSTPIGVDS